MDPGLLALGALAIGASALLPQFSKSRKEGFEVVPTAGYPEVAETGNEIFNKLTLASDPRSESVRLSNLPKAEQNAYKDAVDNVFSTQSVTFDRGQVSITKEETKNPVYLPDDDSILKRAAFCSNKQITANVFQDAQFDRDCGVCVTAGTTFDNKPFTGAKGMLVLPEQKKEFLEQRNNKQEAYSRGKPTYGYCERSSTGIDHDFTFALDAKELKPLTERQRCRHNRSLDGSCATCLADNKFTFVGRENRTLTPVTFTLFGTNAWVEATMAGTRIDFNAPNGQNRILLNNTSKVFTIVLNEGAFLNISVTGWGGGDTTNRFSKAEVWGFMEFANSTGGKEQIPLDRILLKDERIGGTPKYAKSFANVNGIFCRKLVKPSGQESSIFTGQLPFLLVSDFPFEGIDCKSSLLQTLPSSVEKFGGDPCYKPSTQGPGSWTDACLRDRIQTMGCTQNGDLFKNPSQLRSLTMTQMIQTIQATRSKQFTDNTSSMKCNGKNISTPCDGFVNFDPEETPELTDQCIEFLYFNRGADKPNIGATYSGPTNTFFSQDSNGKKIMCLPGARMDPAIRNQSMLNYFKSVYRNGFIGPAGLDAVKRVMNLNYNRAVNTSLNAGVSDSQGGRKDAIANCFATLANIPENVLPDKKLPNARYCRVRYPPPGRNMCIQISQIAVFDNREVNVAVGKPVMSTPPLAPDCNAERAVDGKLMPRGHPFEYHSLCRQGDYWVVDFGKLYPVKRVEYYNRADCCADRANGMLVELLDERINVVWQQTLDGTLVQKYSTLSKNYNV